MSFKNKMFHMICLCVIPILLMAGCGGEQEESAEEPALLKELEEGEAYNLAAQEWAGFQEIEKTDSLLTVTEYFDDFGKDPEPDMMRYNGYSATDQENYYRIQSYAVEDNDITKYAYYLHSINTTILETNTVRLALDEADGVFSDEEKETAYLVGADAINGKLCAFFVIWNSDEKDYSNYLAVWMDQNGTVERVTDFLPAILENRELQKNSNWFPTNTVYDPDGYYYVIDGNNREIMVTNENGEKLDLITLQDCRGITSKVTKAPDGSPIFEYESTNGNTVVFSMDGTEKIPLFSGSGIGANIRKLNSYGKIIYLDNNRLLYWDASKGQCKSIYDANGINSFDCTAIMGSVTDELILIFEDDNTSYLYKLKAAPEFEPTEIILLQWRDDKYTRNCAAEYSRKHPGVVITVQQQEDKSDVSFVRIVEDMKAGNGPDMLVISREQLIDMEKAGVLADLSDILPKQIQDQVFSGVLQNGIIGDKLYGIPYEAYVDTLFVSNDIWSEDTWTIEDMMELTQKDPTVERCISIPYSLTADQMLYDLCVINLESSGFIDFQKLTCSFESEEFCSLLKFCKDYGEAPGSRNNMTVSEQRDEVLSGGALAYYLAGGFIQFSSQRAMFGEDFHCVGFPANGMNGSIVSCYSCVAVNDRTENTDIIEDFVQFLLSEESQVAYTVNWVRRDVMTNHVREHTGRSEGPVFILDNRSIIPLEGRADGSSYLEEYLNLMEEGAASCTKYEIMNIILEEAMAYFSDDKSLQETTDVIQKRVQNYLDERK